MLANQRSQMNPVVVPPRVVADPVELQQRHIDRTAIAKTSHQVVDLSQAWILKMINTKTLVSCSVLILQCIRSVHMGLSYLKCTHCLRCIKWFYIVNTAELLN